MRGDLYKDVCAGIRPAKGYLKTIEMFRGDDTRRPR